MGLNYCLRSMFDLCWTHIFRLFPYRGVENLKILKKSIIFGMVRDALGGIGGSSLSILTGFSKDFEKNDFSKIKS